MQPNPVVAVNPSQASLDLLKAWPDNSPICMVNLLAFDGADGREAYGRYTAVAAQTVAAQGGSAIFMAPVIESDDGWDSVVLVYYPRRAAYLDMQNDPAYVGAIPDRTAGLSARLLYPFALPDTPDAPEVTGDGVEVFSVELLRWTDPSAQREPVGGIALDLPVGGPGLNTDGRWDRMRLARHPSIEEARVRSDRSDVDPSAEATMYLVAQPRLAQPGGVST